MRRRPEILAPAGSPDCLAAAVAGGADAVYMGLRHFNARGRAENFRLAELPGHVAYLHRHGLKCYVVMNTLLHDDEHAKALAMAWEAWQAGIDAVILQDLGLWQLLGDQVPELERHASTQMTVHEAGQIAVLAELGARRIILARELSVAEVAACTRAAADLGVETEHFVHGALCYAYSGQCLISNFAGCRSANRGTCAQNCRFDYRAGGEADPDTHLSMKDQALVGQVAAFADAGVASLKIEGRLKGPEYVFTTASVYRRAVDAWESGRAVDVAGAESELRSVFARPFTTALAEGANDGPGRLRRYRPEADRRPDASLLAIDRRHGRALLRSAERPQAGWGYACTVGFYNDGFLLTAVDPGPEADSWQCRLRIDPRGPRLPVGLALFRNIDHDQKQRLRSAVASVAADPERDRPGRDVHLSLTVRIGEALRLACAERMVSGPVVEPARGGGLDEAQARRAIGTRLAPGFRLASLSCAIAPGAFVPAAALRRLRQDLMQDVAAAVPAISTPPQLVELPERVPPPQRTALWVAVRDAATAAAALTAGAEAVWLDGWELWGSTPPSTTDLPVGCWIRHPAVAAVSPHLAALGLPVVAGHLGVIRAATAAGLAVQADHHLNVCSVRSLQVLGGLGATAAVLSLECSAREVARLLRRRPPHAPALALTVHGRLPAMITRQDHGTGSGLRATEADGARPYELERRAGGYSVLWEGARLCAPEAVQRSAGLVAAWVLELADLDAAGVARTVAAYAALRDGRLQPAALTSELADLAPHGWFPGHLHQGSRALDGDSA